MGEKKSILDLINKILFGFIIPLLIIFAAFKNGILLGIATIILYIGIWIFIKRAAVYEFSGRYAYTKNNLEKAFKLFEKAYKAKGCNRNFKILYGYLLLKQGEMAKSEEVFNLLMKEKITQSQEMQIKSNLALILWKKDKIDDALELLEKVYEQYKNTAVYGSLGYMYILKGDAKKAMEFNLEAYEYNDSDNIILDNMGQAYYINNEYDKAKEIYEKLIPKAPTFPEAYYNYGLVLFKLNMKDEALQQFKKAVNYKFSFVSTITKEEVEQRIKELE